MRNLARSTQWRSGAVAWSLLASALLFAPTHSPPPETAAFHFRFNPPYGTSFREIEKRTLARSLGSLPADVIVLESESRVSVRRTAAGSTFTYLLTSVRATRRGRDEGFLVAPLRGCRVSLDVDPRGKVVAMRNFDQITRAYRERLPPLVGLVAGFLIDEQGMQEEVRREWDDRVADLVGVQAGVGRFWTLKQELPMPTGKLPVFSAAAITDRTSCDGIDCVRLKWRTSTSPQALRPLVGDGVKEFGPAAEKKGVPPPAMELDVVGERLIDPATLRQLRETVKRTTRVHMNVPFMGRTPIVSEDTKETCWVYPK